MFEAKLTIVAPDLTQAIHRLADALLGNRTLSEQYAAHRERQRTEPTTPTQTPPVTEIPVAAAPTVPTVPVAPTAVPTAAAPVYTPDQVGKAGADLLAADPGKMPQLLALLQQFGVRAITELRQDQLGAFATSLRELGAKL